MLRPNLDQYRIQIAQGRCVPLRQKIPADLETPVSAFIKLKQCGAVFLLESVEQGIQVGRYSFIGLRPYTLIKLQDGRILVDRDGEISNTEVDLDDPFAPVRRELADSGLALDLEIPGPFAGAVGYIAYDMVRYFEDLEIPPGDTLQMPDYQFVFPSALAVFDHVKCEIEIAVLPPNGDPEEAYAKAAEQVSELLSALAAPLVVEDRCRSVNSRKPDSNMTEDAFKKNVQRAKEHILAGDAFQIVLSQRLSGETEASPLQIYRALRILNPSPYMYFIDFKEYQIVGSSPEVLVKLENGQATVCPIAGTRPRGETPADDQELAADLLACKKERAEHVMLVDLGRNDLGRVCKVGSVEAQSFMQIEKYSHVMHIVSRVTGRLREDLDMFDLLRATFPAGTVSGAPKIRAMEIISELEGSPRGVYAGAVGYFGRQGDMDIAIAIRTMIIKDNRFYVQGGAGIVADSDPAFEFQETLHKIRALTQAITIAEEGF